MTHNRIKDQIAIVGVGSTGNSRSGARTANSLAAEASIAAIRDAGISREDIGGIVSAPGMGSWMLVPPGAAEMVATLRLPSIVYYADGNGVVVSSFMDAMNALYAGLCDYALVYHYNLRTPFNSTQAANDPYRRNFRGYHDAPPENTRFAAAYAAWCSRYMAENGLNRTHLGRIAVNSRTNAVDNPLAAMRIPMTLEQYMNGRMIRDPLCMFDMDLPIDGADAFVLTTADRARDLPNKPVLIHTAAQGLCETASDEEQLRSLGHHGQDVVAKQIWARSDRTLSDVDLLYLYDGFSFVAISWLEKHGWCAPGDAGGFVEQHWNEEQNRLLIDGRVVVNSQGGMLSEGGSQGAGFVREAVHQLRGTAGDRQIAGSRTALIANGGFFFNAQSMILVGG